MPTKKTKSGREYQIDGKKFLWFPLDEDDNPMDEPIKIPLRLKLGALRSVGALDEMDASAMFTLLEKIMPNQADALDDLDLNDFMEMFTTWQDEYEALSGATVGESVRSST